MLCKIVLTSITPQNIEGPGPFSTNYRHPQKRGQNKLKYIEQKFCVLTWHFDHKQRICVYPRNFHHCNGKFRFIPKIVIILNRNVGFIPEIFIVLNRKGVWKELGSVWPFCWVIWTILTPFEITCWVLATLVKKHVFFL